MKLIDLVNAYKGDVRFDVNIVADDGIADVVVFVNGEESAIKESVLNSVVSNFRVTGIYDSVPTVNVLVKEDDTKPSNETNAGDSSPNTPTEDTNKSE